MLERQRYGRAMSDPLFLEARIDVAEACPDQQLADLIMDLSFIKARSAAAGKVAEGVTEFET